MDLKTRLTEIRDNRNMTWKTLAESLDISIGMLFACMSGKRNPSSRFLKRIAAFESGEYSQQPSTCLIAKESTNGNMSRKQVNMLEVEQRLAKISGEIAAIRELIREARHE